MILFGVTFMLEIVLMGIYVLLCAFSEYYKCNSPNCSWAPSFYRQYHQLLSSS